MVLSYMCPKCKTNLNPNIRVILIAKRGDKRGLMLLSPRLGDYDFKCDRELNGLIRAGDAVEFLCPVCHESLTSSEGEHFAELLAIDPANHEPKTKIVRFSCICNEHATFIYDEDSVNSFGKDNEKYQRKMRIDGNWGW